MQEVTSLPPHWLTICFDETQTNATVDFGDKLDLFVWLGKYIGDVCAIDSSDLLDLAAWRSALHTQKDGQCWIGQFETIVAYFKIHKVHTKPHLRWMCTQAKNWESLSALQRHLFASNLPPPDSDSADSADKVCKVFPKRFKIGSDGYLTYQVRHVLLYKNKFGAVPSMTNSRNTADKSVARWLSKNKTHPFVELLLS